MSDLTNVFDSYHARLLLLALSILKNRQDAEDCLQEVYLKLHRTRALSRFEGRSAIETYLHRCVINEANDHISKKIRRARILRRCGLSESAIAHAV